MFQNQTNDCSEKIWGKVVFFLENISLLTKF